jgi:hypothetical protein
VARGVPADPQTAHLRGRIAGLSRAVRNGERPANDPDLDDCRRQLAARKLAEYAKDIVANWPPLTDEEVDGVVSIIRGAAR